VTAPSISGWPAASIELSRPEEAVMKPYFQTHPAGVAYLLVILIWYGAEIIEFFRQQGWRKDATRISPPAFWPVFGAYAIAAVTMLLLAPRLAPAAAIGPGAVTFAVGLALLVPGVALRLWSFQTLGRYFTFTVKVSTDQPVIARGPYRLLRHPGYAGGLLATIGVALQYGNWLSLASVTLSLLAILVWRIRTEENALLAALGDRYGAYAARHRRLVPLIW
jgi:protein-S-isoprenylcysteine O-methyltransferase Ste14